MLKLPAQAQVQAQRHRNSAPSWPRKRRPSRLWGWWLTPALVGLLLGSPKASAETDFSPDLALPAGPTAAVTALPTTDLPQTGEGIRQVVALATPSLPELGQPDRFLPAPSLVRLVIKLSDRRVYVYSRDQVKTSFPVAIGREGWETPVGSHQVISMQPDPIWQHPFTGELVPPGRDNPLGSRWIGFWTNGTNVIGFHGTPNPESVGHPASHGCVRMYNQDVVQLFEMVRPGTPVEVIP
ncbi:MAG: L,D-transpeptidase [Elainella sp.]